ncbi:MAG: hypothetical protein ACRCYU_14650 [Nocardioides sp.]
MTDDNRETYDREARDGVGAAWRAPGEAESWVRQLLHRAADTIDVRPRTPREMAVSEPSPQQSRGRHSPMVTS